MSILAYFELIIMIHVEWFFSLKNGYNNYGFVNIHIFLFYIGASLKFWLLSVEIISKSGLGRGAFLTLCCYSNIPLQGQYVRNGMTWRTDSIVSTLRDESTIDKPRRWSDFRLVDPAIAVHAIYRFCRLVFRRGKRKQTNDTGRNAVRAVWTTPILRVFIGPMIHTNRTWFVKG